MKFYWQNHQFKIFEKINSIFKQIFALKMVNIQQREGERERNEDREMETEKWRQRNGDREMETGQRCEILFQ